MKSEGINSEKSKCPVAIANALQSIIINKTDVPADLRSAGIKYKDLLIRLKYRLFKLRMIS